MHDHNLDDLIIDNIEPKHSKTKSFLTIIALLIVVLIVAIILTKILLKTPNNTQLAFEENATELIAPELKLKEIPQPQKEEEEETPLSQIIESKQKVAETEPQKPVVIEEPTVVIKKEKTEPETKKEPVLSNILDEEIKAPVVETKKPVIVQESLETRKQKEAKDAADIAYWKAVQEKRKAEKIARESATNKEPSVVIKTEKTKEVVKKPLHIKEPVKSEKVKTTVVEKPKPVSKSLSTKKYYVQVGSFRTKPSSRFISVIRNNGFQYTIKYTSDGTKKLLIGPYEDRVSVNRALVRVKDRINKSAFVVKR